MSVILLGPRVHRFFPWLLVLSAAIGGLSAVPHDAAAATAQELVCGEPVSARLTVPAQVDGYTFRLESIHDVSLAVSDPTGSLGLLRLIVSDDRGEILADTCQGLVNLRLVRGDYDVAVRDCLGSDQGDYTLRYTRQAVNYRPVAIAISPDGGRAWVTNGVSGSIAGLDLASGDVVTEFRSPDDRLGPRALALTDDDATAYVANHSFNAVNHVDLESGQVGREIRLDMHFHPEHLILVAENQRIFVTGEHEQADSLRIIDLELDRIRTVLTGEGPGNLALSPDGRTVYVSSAEHGIDVVDVASESVTRQIATGGTAVDVAFTRDGSKALVVDRDGERIVVIDTALGEVVHSLAVADRPCPLGRPYEPVAIAVSPLGDRAVVVNRGCFSVSLIDLTGDPPTLLRTVFLTGRLGFLSLPQAVAFAPDGGHAYVVNYVTDSIAELDVAAGNFRRYLPLAPPPSPCAVPVADNDACAQAREVVPAPDFIDFVETSTASRDDSDPVPWCANQDYDRRARSVWYRFASPGAGILSVDTFGSTYNTILAAFTGDCGAFVPLPDGCSDDHIEPQSRVAFSVTPGAVYYFLITAFEHAGGILGFNAFFQPDPNAPTPTPVAIPSCAGDCDGDSQVTVDEILVAVSISLGTAPAGECAATDSNHDDRVTVDELVAAINSALLGCRDPE